MIRLKFYLWDIKATRLRLTALARFHGLEPLRELDCQWIVFRLLTQPHIARINATRRKQID